jgi:hypothetical protein
MRKTTCSPCQARLAREFSSSPGAFVLNRTHGKSYFVGNRQIAVAVREESGTIIMVSRESCCQPCGGAGGRPDASACRPLIMMACMPPDGEVCIVTRVGFECLQRSEVRWRDSCRRDCERVRIDEVNFGSENRAVLGVGHPMQWILIVLGLLLRRLGGGCLLAVAGRAFRPAAGGASARQAACADQGFPASRGIQDCLDSGWIVRPPGGPGAFKHAAVPGWFRCRHRERLLVFPWPRRCLAVVDVP